ncbi:sugar ABC transporter ATP-binding protein [Acidipropionibacterium virtanenii]|uniref:Arabinose import ATP-binding protein AraG n=1 Tax=Acidipropionibacterium virtanenii TaxID=2057246 RepID=A0A344UXS0_9ACTN|nr:sugar ABC transporter ATP-binding protein [Acidipropionibacterium virtanenii]AXE40068.1 Arabinose import ATP-binding protein AraG [Acidipropionibacterium virtanenii]
MSTHNFPEATPLLQLRGISKRYGATQALNSVDFDAYPGEVHALMGENGAGKSTLMKILAGNESRDAGTILIDGEAVEISSPADAVSHGIAIIHQELNTVPDMTVAENLALGREPRGRLGALDRRRMLTEARRKLALIGAEIDPRTTLGRLSVGRQQMVEIARAVSENARVLVLDEPTAALSRTESEQLYSLIQKMRDDGVALIYISHRMEEVWMLADRVTVFRDGGLVGTRDKETIEPADVVRMMVGRDVVDLYGHERRSPSEVLLEVHDLTGAAAGPASLSVRAGEVVAMAGLIGSGRTELVRMIFGADPAFSGTVEVAGRSTPPRRPSEAIHRGIAMVPESRKEQALFPEQSVERNISISTLPTYSPGGVMQARKARTAAKQEMKRLNLRENAIDLPARALSGGNQQKIVLARWLMADSDVLILDEPTRGVDIGAKSEIYDAINSLAEAGKAILVVSSDLPEAIGISDRVLVMRHGRIVADLDSATTTEENVMLHATGTAATREEKK